MPKRVHTCKTYIRVYLPCEELKQKLAAFADFREEHGCLYTGLNEEYDVDINCMIRKTIKDIFGREDEFAALLREYNAKAYLVIVPYIVHASPLPAPILSLDNDIIAFLHRTGIGEDLDYYVL